MLSYCNTSVLFFPCFNAAEYATFYIACEPVPLLREIPLGICVQVLLLLKCKRLHLVPKAPPIFKTSPISIKSTVKNNVNVTAFKLYMRFLSTNLALNVLQNHPKPPDVNGYILT